MNNQTKKRQSELQIIDAFLNVAFDIKHETYDKSHNLHHNMNQLNERANADYANNRYVRNKLLLKFIQHYKQENILIFAEYAQIVRLIQMEHKNLIDSRDERVVELLSELYLYELKAAKLQNNQKKATPLLVEKEFESGYHLNIAYQALCDMYLPEIKEFNFQ